MLLVMKMTSLAFNLHDGERREAYRAVAATPGKEKLGKLLEGRIARSVAALPDPLTFFAFAFHFSTFFAGPAFEFSEYVRGTTEAGLREGTEAGKPTNKRWGSRIIAALQRLGASLLCLAGFVLTRSFLDWGQIYAPTFICESASTDAGALACRNQGASHRPLPAALPFLYRAAIIWACLSGTRWKYYFAWLMTEGSAIIAGFGCVQPRWSCRDTCPHPMLWRCLWCPPCSFQSTMVKEKRIESWGGVSNVDVLRFELPLNLTDATKQWNIQTQQWLARYCNQRLPQGINTYATYLLSAFWHGAIACGVWW